MAVRGTVLIIDDDVMTAAVFAQMLRLYGYEVITAIDPESGFQATKTTTFDAVLLDLVMPVTDGLEWLRRFRATPSHPTTPVAIITGNLLIDEEMVHELEQLGAVVRFKPVWADDLVAIAQSLLEGNRPPTEGGRS